MAVPNILQYRHFTIPYKQKESYGPVNPTKEWHLRHYNPLYMWLVTPHNYALPYFMYNIKTKLLVGQYHKRNTSIFSFNQSFTLVYIDVLQHRRKNSLEIIRCQGTLIFLYVTLATVQKDFHAFVYTVLQVSKESVSFLIILSYLFIRSADPTICRNCTVSHRILKH